jgi:hypothetical protein
VLRRFRGVGERLAPGFVAGRDRRYQQRLRERLGFPEQAESRVDAYGDLVSTGPLAGMRYPLDLLARADAPLSKLEGTYELPLQAAIVEAISRLRGTGGTFVDLGCADGYYAVGVGLAAGCAVEAFDLARSARRATSALAAANAVEVHVHGRATSRWLERHGGGVRALLCDIEGAEARVLTVRAADALRDALVIVELHGRQTEVVARFSATHDVEIVDSVSTSQELRVSATPWLVARPTLR